MVGKVYICEVVLRALVYAEDGAEPALTEVPSAVADALGISYIASDDVAEMRVDAETVEYSPTGRRFIPNADYGPGAVLRAYKNGVATGKTIDYEAALAAAEEDT